MDLPLLMAGPILRRVEPTLVSVWLALSQSAKVGLRIWEGRAESGRSDVYLEAEAAHTLRVGARLHLVEVTLRIPDAQGKSLAADHLYSYDVEITPDGTVTAQNLGSLGMLTPDDGGNGKRVVRAPLGFEPNLLPSFAPPPLDLANLNLLYGSCRRSGHPDPDALAMVDDLIFGDDRYKDPRARPHQLFLGGDQIYADDVTPLHMLLVMALSEELIGTTGTDPLLAEPIEHVRLDHTARRKDQTVVDQANPAASYRPEDDVETAFDPDLPVDRAHFPEERRLSTTRRDAQFTSEDGKSHVISLGEFAALYLTVWSNTVWGTQVTGALFDPDPTTPNPGRAFGWQDDLPTTGEISPTTGEIRMPAVVFPDRIAGNLYVQPETAPEPLTDEQKTAAAKDRQHDLRRNFVILREFHKTLPKVQRALANVPTYMILDDHDVTDDYFLNPIWRDRVLTTQLGQAIIRNAMVAYALFQDWGNDPLTYESGPHKDLLTLVPQLFPPGAEKGPDLQVAEQIAHLLGHDLRNTPTADGRYEPVDPPLRWHFTIDGPKHRVIALDNRTRRSYGSREGPPGNVSFDAQVDQIPLPPLPAGREVLVVVAPLQVIGPPVLDEIVAPLSYRLLDLKESTDANSDVSPSSTTGLREMLGTDPDAIEAWAFDTVTFEHLLARLAPYQRVVLLSGDVHYSSATQMSYWRGDATLPARFAQFTSSGFKNVMPAKVTFVDRAMGFAQQLVRANLATERIGWDRPLDDLVLLPPGVSQLDLVPAMRSRLQSVPVLVPTWGWPEASRLNPARPPDWRWRVKALLDDRAEESRPAGVRLLALDEAAIDQDLADPSTVLEAYQAIAARHQHAMNRLRQARQFLFRANVGRVHFETHSHGQLDAIHEVFTTFSDPDQPGATAPRPEPFLVQRAALGPAAEDPPSKLRQKALVIPIPAEADA